MLTREQAIEKMKKPINKDTLINNGFNYFLLRRGLIT